METDLDLIVGLASVTRSKWSIDRFTRYQTQQDSADDRLLAASSDCQLGIKSETRQRVPFVEPSRWPAVISPSLRSLLISSSFDSRLRTRIVFVSSHIHAVLSLPLILNQ